MEVVEKLADGLKREVSVNVPLDELKSQRDAKVDELKDKVQLKGFRPGKVPKSHILKMYGPSIMQELIGDILNKNAQKILSDRDEKSAFEPKIDLPEEEEKIKKVLSCEGDLEYTMSYEVIPTIDIMDLKSISITRPVVEVDEEEVEKAIQDMASQNKSYDDKGDDAVAEDGDKATINFLGKLDGEPFEGGAADGTDLVLGAGQFIPGFEDNVVGMKVGESKTFPITFPEDYPAPNLAGKETTFDVKVTAVAAPGEVEINDELAKSMGMEDLAALREAFTGRFKENYAQASRQKAKRKLLDALNEGHDFELPPTLVEQEFNSIWDQMQKEMEKGGESFEDAGTTEEKAREEYQTIAQRRVRLGLLISEIGSENDVKIEETEVQRAVQQQMMQMPGREQELINFYRENPNALAQLRAPIFEDKVVDFILELATVTDETVTKEELLKQDEEDA